MLVDANERIFLVCWRELDDPGVIRIPRHREDVDIIAGVTAAGELPVTVFSGEAGALPTCQSSSLAGSVESLPLHCDTVCPAHISSHNSRPWRPRALPGAREAGDSCRDHRPGNQHSPRQPRSHLRPPRTASI